MLAATLTTACGKKDDPIAKAEQKDVAKGGAAAGIVETKAIAEAGFVYGLPLVMNYAVMNEFAVDTKSSQFKAPFNAIYNERRVAGIYGNDALEATYPYTRTDATGEALDTSKPNYTITFPAGQLPPVNSFWSITMYDGKSQLLIKNPIDRYLINSPMMSAMKTNADGSLTLYIQKDSPGAEKAANWLPAPDGPVYLVMRLYWPKDTPPSILPAGEGTWKPPGLVAAK